MVQDVGTKALGLWTGRSRMTGVRVEGNNVEVTSNGARFSLSMAPALRDAAARWFG